MKPHRKIEELNAAEATAETGANEFADKIVGEHFATKFGAPRSGIRDFFQPLPSISSELIHRHSDLERLARAVFRSRDEANRWFDTPKPTALRHHTPRSFISTTSGCDIVEKLLRELNS